MDLFDKALIREMQEKSLDMLLYFKEFCDRHHLLFYFCGGCCIGTLRHKGFIPWDDDVDVFMPRDDYEKLKKLWNKEADTSRYTCVFTSETVFDRNPIVTIRDQNTTLVKDFQYGLDIPHGLAMDILPLDGYPEKKLERKFQLIWALIFLLYCTQVVPKNHGKLIHIAGTLALHCVPSKKLKYKIWKTAERKMSKYKISDCNYITELCAGPKYMHKRYPKELFESAVLKEFEGKNLPLPVGYDEYLKIAFGDYMSLPKEESRVPHHDFVFCDLSKSYREYGGSYPID